METNGQPDLEQGILRGFFATWDDQDASDWQTNLKARSEAEAIDLVVKRYGAIRETVKVRKESA